MTALDWEWALRTGGNLSAADKRRLTRPRLLELNPRWVHDGVARHPRHDFKRHLAIALARECELVPDGRPSWLCRWASFQALIKAAPFAE